jgi:hypothetical protein
LYTNLEETTKTDERKHVTATQKLAISQREKQLKTHANSMSFKAGTTNI